MTGDEAAEVQRGEETEMNQAGPQSSGAHC